MTLIKWRPRKEWDPFADILDLQKEINRLFNLSLTRTFRPMVEGEWVPPINVYKKGDKYVLQAELPGLSKDDVEITVQNNIITISGEKKQEKEIKEEDYYCYERSFGKFHRSFELPAEVDANKVTATFSQGVLKVELPIAESAKPKQIKVNIEEEK